MPPPDQGDSRGGLPIRDGRHSDRITDAKDVVDVEAEGKEDQVGKINVNNGEVDHHVPYGRYDDDDDDDDDDNDNRLNSAIMMTSSVDDDVVCNDGYVDQVVDYYASGSDEEDFFSSSFAFPDDRMLKHSWSLEVQFDDSQFQLTQENKAEVKEEEEEEEVEEEEEEEKEGKEKEVGGGKAEESEMGLIVDNSSTPAVVVDTDELLRDYEYYDDGTDLMTEEVRGDEKGHGEGAGEGVDIDKTIFSDETGRGHWPELSEIPTPFAQGYLTGGGGSNLNLFPHEMPFSSSSPLTPPPFPPSSYNETASPLRMTQRSFSSPRPMKRLQSCKCHWCKPPCKLRECFDKDEANKRVLTELQLSLEHLKSRVRFCEEQWWTFKDRVRLTAHQGKKGGRGKRGVRGFRRESTGDYDFVTLDDDDEAAYNDVDERFHV